MSTILNNIACLVWYLYLQQFNFSTKKSGLELDTILISWVINVHVHTFWLIFLWTDWWSPAEPYITNERQLTSPGQVRRIWGWIKVFPTHNLLNVNKWMIVSSQNNVLQNKSDLQYLIQCHIFTNKYLIYSSNGYVPSWNIWHKW